MAIKVLKPERISTDMLREFAQEVYIMRFVCIIEYNWWSFCFPLLIFLFLLCFLPFLLAFILLSGNGKGNAFSNEDCAITSLFLFLIVHFVLY